jgi:hypothetical protein
VNGALRRSLLLGGLATLLTLAGFVGQRALVRFEALETRIAQDHLKIRILVARQRAIVQALGEHQIPVPIGNEYGAGDD